MADNRTSREQGHFHYFRIDANGNGRTSVWNPDDKRTTKGGRGKIGRHFHRVINFVVQEGGLDGHTHELRGDLANEIKRDATRRDGSMRIRPGDATPGVRYRGTMRDKDLERDDDERTGFGRLRRRRRVRNRGKRGIASEIRRVRRRGIGGSGG
tara:strand:+ start:913 stop:1374 length:462 start_codon:yes stop_codon:yes gene_type:complete